MKKYFLIIKRKYKNSKIRKFFFYYLKNILKINFILIVLFYLFNKNFVIKKFNYYYELYVKKQVLQNSLFCKTVIINGVHYSNYKNIQEKINNFCNDNDYDINQLKNDIIKDPWIKEINIQKLYLNTLKLIIIEYSPFAIWIENSSNINLIDQFGVIIDINKNELITFQDLLIVKGDNFKEEINNFFNLLSIHQDIAIELKQIERIGKRRWNLILNNNILVKMPEEDKDIFKTWVILETILQEENLKDGLLEIDLRIKSKIFLKYKEEISEEIKEFIFK